MRVLVLVLAINSKSSQTLEFPPVKYPFFAAAVAVAAAVAIAVVVAVACGCRCM